MALGLGGCAVARPPASAMPDSAAMASAPRVDPPEPQLMRTLVAVSVVGFTGPGGKPFEVASRMSPADANLHRQIGMKTFALPLRRSAAALTQYPCSTCHQGTTVTARRNVPAHDNIRPVHPHFANGACTTCHVGSSVDQLVLPGGGTATLDQSYRLCAQCHASQVTAWAGGGHGKRLVSWGGRRVVMACTACHDPHRPALEARLPFPGPRIRRTSGGSR